MFFDNWRVKATSIGCLNEFENEIDEYEKLYNNSNEIKKNEIFEYYKKHAEYLEYRMMIKNIDIMLKNTWKEFVGNNPEFNAINNDVIKFTIINTMNYDDKIKILNEFLSRK